MKRIILSIILSGLVAAMPPVALFAEDIFYLESELKEAKRKLGPISSDLAHAGRFLSQYDQNREALAKASAELRELKNQTNALLKKNLIKSTIVLGMETYGKISLVLGFAAQSVKVIAVAVLVEYASNKMQDSLSSAYGQAVKGVSDETQKFLPEFEEIQKTMQMSMDEVKAEARRGGDELGDTAAIYRKFQMLQEKIDRAEARLLGLNRELAGVKAPLEALVGDLDPEAKRLNERIADLNRRLYEARRKERDARMEQAIENANAAVKTPPLPSLPAMSAVPAWPTVEETKKLIEEYKRAFRVFEAPARARWPVLCTELTDLRKKYNDGYAEFLKDLSGKGLIGLNFGQPVFEITSGLPDEVTPMNLYSLPHIVQGHAADKKAAEACVAAIPNAQEGRKRIGGFKDELMQIVQREKELVSLRSFANEVDQLRQKLPGNVILGGFMPHQLLLDLTPKGFDRLARGIDGFGGLEDLDQYLGNLAETLPKHIDVYSKNARAYEKAFPGLNNACEKRYQRLLENLANLENAFAQMKGCAAAYDKNVRKAGWHSARNASSDEHYFSAEDGGLVKNLSFVFNPSRAETELSSALTEESLSRADDVMRRYRALVQMYDDLDAKYSSAWNHYFYYLSEFSGDYGPYLTEMFEASQVPGAELRVKTPDIGGINRRKAATVTFSTVWKPLNRLPEVAVNEKDSVPFEVYRLRKALQAEGASWLALDRSAFAKKFSELSARIEKLRDDTLNAYAVTRLKNEANKLYYDYAAKHPDIAVDLPEPPGSPEPRKPEPATPRYGFFDARLNGRALYGNIGSVALLKNDLRNGTFDVTAQLSTTDKISRLLFSESGGEGWKEIPVSQNISCHIAPLPEKTYEPAVRILSQDGTAYDFRFFPDVRGIVYKDVDYRTLAAQTMKAVAEAYERQDIVLFSRHVSDYFAGGRLTLEEGVRLDFDLFSAVRIVLYIDRIEKRGDAVAVETHWEKTQAPRKTGAQQKSTGKTVFTLALEDELLKIRALRGNLIYATLSPEIASVSGLPQTVVNQISTARDARNPVQPGAETVYDPGQSQTGTDTDQPSVQLVSPNGGESWTVGDTHAITWTMSGAVANVTLEYSTDGGASYPHLIVAQTPAGAGTYSWTVPDTLGTAVRVKVSDAAGSVSDASDANFSIVAAVTIEEGSVSLTQYATHPPFPSGPFLDGYKFSTKQVITETDFNYTSDFCRREGYMEVKNGNSIQDLGAVGINSVSEAPDSGYLTPSDGFPSPVAGHTYAVKLAEGNYALVEIVSLGDVFSLPAVSTFRYKYQKNGTRRFY